MHIKCEQKNQHNKIWRIFLSGCNQCTYAQCNEAQKSALRGLTDWSHNQITPKSNSFITVSNCTFIKECNHHYHIYCCCTYYCFIYAISCSFGLQQHNCILNSPLINLVTTHITNLSTPAASHWMPLITSSTTCPWFQIDFCQYTSTT